MDEGLDTREVLRLLVDDWRKDAGDLQMGRRQHVLIGLSVYGLTAHTHTLAAAALTLDEHGHHLAVVPLVRQAIECAVTAVWIERSGYPAALTLLREQSRHAKNTLAEFVKSGMPHSAEATERVTKELATSLNSTTKSHEAFEKRCGELANGAQLYAMYRAASEVSHAGAALVDRYLVNADITEISPLGVGLRLAPGDEQNDVWLGTMLAMAVHATSAWDRLDKRRVARTRMKDLCSRLDVTYQPELSAAGLKAKRIRDDEFKAWAKQQREGKEADTMIGPSPVTL